ncbi:carbohydrate kinase family protein [Brevibacillus migulae]|uniref:carbohydrate kinase family protein n=1 Tax=Brevibacillus migulae TaxID=1644114 RepID=UPI00106EC5C7|nr:carbohydrate kinase [Brevibacillus migulae]
MGTLYAIGEVLIDFIPLQKGAALKDVFSFERAPGGAPANVAATVAKLGGQASMITKLGQDAFGDFLLEQLQQAGVATDQIKRTAEAKTGLAFVSLKEDGERDFSFYRQPSADLLLTEEEIEAHWFSQGDILHFCSVDLVESPMKHAHRKAIQLAKAGGAIISFDPNVRLPLWERPLDCKKAILEFLPMAHLVKVSDEELPFLTGVTDAEEAIHTLFTGDVKAVLYTKGGAGADLFVKGKAFSSPGYQVGVQDTTGAGDAFIGAVLYQLLERQADQQTLAETLIQEHAQILSFANACGAITTTGKGAMSALPGKAEVIRLMTTE